MAKKKKKIVAIKSTLIRSGLCELDGLFSSRVLYECVMQYGCRFVNVCVSGYFMCMLLVRYNNLRLITVDPITPNAIAPKIMNTHAICLTDIHLHK